tara:strand:+ start:1082 stop:1363 length:282 start_codon:yes stop_codon:yes gene_type:complete
MVAAPLAGIGLLRLQPIPLSFALTLGASMTLAETHVEKVFKASLVGGKLLEELAYICLFHAMNVGNTLPYVKGIHPSIISINRRFSALSPTGW